MERLPEDTELDRCRKFVEFWEGCTQLQGLAQSNSNARLNNSAKHVAMLLETSGNVQRQQRWWRPRGEAPWCVPVQRGRPAPKSGWITTAEILLSKTRQSKIRKNIAPNPKTGKGGGIQQGKRPAPQMSFCCLVWCGFSFPSFSFF